MVEEPGLVLYKLEYQLNQLPEEAKFMGSLDYLSGFDFLKTRGEDTKYFFIAPPSGVYRMIASPPGYINTPSLFMDRINNCVQLIYQLLFFVRRARVLFSESMTQFSVRRKFR